MGPALAPVSSNAEMRSFSELSNVMTAMLPIWMAAQTIARLNLATLAQGLEQGLAPRFVGIIIRKDPSNVTMQIRFQGMDVHRLAKLKRERLVSGPEPILANLCVGMVS